MKRLKCNDSNFKSDPLFNREPMKLNKQRSDMITSTENIPKLKERRLAYSCNMRKH